MNILHIDCSPRPQSRSRQLSAAIVDRLRAIHPQTTVIRRDLGCDQIPHAAPGYATALSSPTALAAAGSNDTLRLSEELIAELEASHLLVIGTPMNNFAVPSVLKAWIDQIVRVGRTFRVTSTGKIGLLRDRPVFVGIASGGIFSGPHASQPDFLTPYLTAVFRCVGLNNIHFVTFQATAFLDEQTATMARNQVLSLLDGAIDATKRLKAAQ